MTETGGCFPIPISAPPKEVSCVAALTEMEVEIHQAFTLYFPNRKYSLIDLIWALLDFAI